MLVLQGVIRFLRTKKLEFSFMGKLCTYTKVSGIFSFIKCFIKMFSFPFSWPIVRINTRMYSSQKRKFSIPKKIQLRDIHSSGGTG
jgi:hypothetical protein